MLGKTNFNARLIIIILSASINLPCKEQVRAFVPDTSDSDG